MAYFEKTYHTPGTPPGTLLEREEELPGEFSYLVIDYSASTFEERLVASAEECREFYEKDTTTWLHVHGRISVDGLVELGEIFNLHPLALEDVLNKGQRPKIDEYDDSFFVIMSLLLEKDGRITTDQVSIFMAKNFILTLTESEVDPFEPLRQRIRNRVGRIRSLKADYLLYSILDLLIDQQYPILEQLGAEMETMEEDLLNEPQKKETLGNIHRVRRELLQMRRNLWPQREVLNALVRNEHSLFEEGTVVYLRDCYDHTIQILDILENYREMGTSLIDVYLSSVSYRLNEIMRVLTIIATIFIPLTFVTGLYGMNFSNPESPWAMPELGWYYGYPFVLGLMSVIVIVMIVYFRRREWV